MAEYCAGLSCIKPCFDAVIAYTGKFLSQPHISPILSLNTGTSTHPGPSIGMSSSPSATNASQEVIMA
jgi:hypothetical protein